MNTREVETLLEKFYEGNTSLQEEKALRDFFRGQDVPAHLSPHQHLFTFFGDEQHQEIPDQEFDQKLSTRLMEQPDETPVIRMRPVRSRNLFVYGFAATILLLIGLFFTFQRDIFKKSGIQNVNPETEIAYAEASEALLIVSDNLNHGLRQAEHLQKVEKAMKSMELFNKFYQYQTIIINPDDISDQSTKSK